MDRIKQTWIAFGLLWALGAAALAADAPATQPAVSPMVTRSTDGSNSAMTGNVNGATGGDAQTGNTERRRNRRTRGNRAESTSLTIGSADPYAVLRSRSIFVKGNQTITADSSPSRSAADSLANHPGSALVFNGVIMVGDQANAMIEDTGSSQVSLVKAGDPIAAGKISAITFDDLTYEVSGQEKHVSLGQNMDGIVPSVTAVAPSVSPSGAAPASTSDGTTPPGSGDITPGATGAPASAGSSGASPEDILARMRAKRNQELGIK